MYIKIEKGGWKFISFSQHVMNNVRYFAIII